MLAIWLALAWTEKSCVSCNSSRLINSKCEWTLKLCHGHKINHITFTGRTYMNLCHLASTWGLIFMNYHLIIAICLLQWYNHRKATCQFVTTFKKQDCIPVGCVSPARWSYLPACSVAGGCLLGGVSASLLGGVCSRGCLLPGCGGGCLLLGVSQHALRQTPPVNRITHACENITLPQLRCGR